MSSYPHDLGRLNERYEKDHDDPMLDE